MKKATYIGKAYDEKGRAELEYSYRGHTYWVTDYGWQAGGESLAIQHKDEQERIDKIIAWDEMDRSNERDASEGFKLFWEYVEGDGE